jgi:lipopolysaccharide assembly outer membrane protein LptD (OstA)
VSVQEGTATLSGERLEADTGLQTVSLTPARLTFRDPARKQTWTARAELTSRQADGTLGLKHVVGTVTDAVGPIELTADDLRWKPPDPVVTATGRVHLQSEAHDFRLKANRIEWNRDTQRITASGQVEWASNLLAPDPSKCSGNVVVYDLVTKELKVR